MAWSTGISVLPKALNSYSTRGGFCWYSYRRISPSSSTRGAAGSGSCGKYQAPCTLSLVAGELSLNGKLRPIKGALSIAIAPKKPTLSLLSCLPKILTKPLLWTFQFTDLLIKHSYPFSQWREIMPCTHRTREFFAKDPDFKMDFSDVNGQPKVKRTLEIAAAGNHHVLLIRPPGSGKTMLARRLPTIMPSLYLHEALKVTRIYSVAGLLKTEGLFSISPFRLPHHTISDIALVGGGTIPQTGNGVKSRPAGVLVSMLSAREMRSAFDSLNISANSSNSFVLRASLAGFEKIKPVIRPLRISASKFGFRLIHDDFATDCIKPIYLFVVPAFCFGI